MILKYISKCIISLLPLLCQNLRQTMVVLFMAKYEYSGFHLEDFQVDINISRLAKKS